MSTLFYRKLDILNRIYILNYLDLALLEQSAVLQIPEQMDYDIKSLQAVPYFNLQDSKLILASCSTKKLTYLFKQALLYIIAFDRSVSLNGKILAKLQQHYSNKDLDSSLHLNAKSDHIEFITYLFNYEISDILSHLQHLFFQSLVTYMPKQVKSRFILDFPDSALINKLNYYDLKAIITEHTNKIYPTLSILIRELGC